MIRLHDQKKAFLNGVPQGAMFWNGHKVGPADKAPLYPLAACYGVGLGQAPLRLDPLDAVLGGSGNVASIPNKRGAGAGIGQRDRRPSSQSHFTAFPQVRAAIYPFP
ncbi:MAG: hypothetical protein Q4G49_13080 [Paracoccus sp. (in: a-proteobacteria)]|nr:hypothetical protein [Paracoccus sp. (in: a-proteobacteria)]